MRGQRQVFARGLALALIKKLTLEGDEIWVRFFDSRMHETIKVGRSGQVPVPYLLSFRSERGRNYGKVFRQLLVEVTRLRREQKRRVVMYVITHGQCHIEPELVTALKQQAFLYGVVCLPSSDQLPDFVPLLADSIHETTGSLDPAFYLSGGLLVAAVLLSRVIRRPAEPGVSP